MSNTYLKSTIEEKLTFSKPPFSTFKKFVLRSAFGELELTQISLNFIKMESLGAKLCLGLLLSEF